MKLTRDQLRAARVLLHLRQDQLAEIATVGVATIRRFEGGKGIGPLHLDALRRAVEEAGAVLIHGDGDVDGTPRGLGVALRARGELPEATLTRIEADRRPNVDEPDPAISVVASTSNVAPSRPRGRPRRIRA